MLGAAPVLAATYGYAPMALAWIDNTAHTDVTWGGSGQCTAWNSSPIDDDGTAPINIGFTFRYGATDYTQLRINSNGRLQFNNNYCGYGTQTVGPPPTYPYAYPNANMNNTMRVYGADFCPAGGGTGCSGRVTYATTGTAPNRRFIVTWSRMKEWNSGTSLFDVQMILEEGGDFIYQFKNISNVSQGVGQVGYQLSLTDYALVDMVTVNSLAYSAVRFFKPTAPLAEYRFDECAGTTTIDYSGNNYHGTVTGGITLGSGGRICSADTFNGTTGHVQLPASFPHLGSASGHTNFTITAWINSTNAAKSGQRVLVDDQNNTVGFAVSLGDGGTGRVRFFSRAVNPIIFDSPAVVTSNNWHFVVATHDATLKRRRLIIYDASGNLLSDTNDTYTGTWGADAGRVALGGENAASTENSSNYRFEGRIDELRAYSRVLADTEIAAIYVNEVQGLHRDATLRACSVCGATLGNFNAFDTNTSSTATAGYIKTKIAGTTFAGSTSNIDVVSLTGGFLSLFTGDTTVQFLDASNDSGAMDSKGCRATWTVINTDAGLAPFTLAFVNQRRVSMPAKTPANSWPVVRIKVINAATPANYGCSNDAFAIRPSYIDTASAAARDQDWLSNGNARTLSNTGASGGNVHAAGVGFSLDGLTAKAVGGATTTNYAGSPALVPGNLLLPDSGYCDANGYTCVPGSFSPGTWIYSSGTLSSTSASYSEAGAFGWEVEDRSFANVDAGDSTKGQRYFRSNTVISTGRFVPASFQLTLNSPVLQTFGSACASRSFTYLGQPFGFASTPALNVRAMNGAATPVQTANYLGVVGSGGIWTLATPLAYASATCTAPTATCAIVRQSGTTSLSTTYALGAATPGWDGADLATQTGAATLASANNGSGTLAFGATDRLKLRRNAASPIGPYTAAVTLAAQLADSSEAGPAGNPTTITGTLAATSVPFDSGAEFRLGRLRLDSSLNSELLPIRVPIRAESYSAGGAWVLNSADNCTAVPTNAFFPSGTGALVPVVQSASPITLAAGQGTLIYNATGNGNVGFFDLAANLNATGNDTSCIPDPTHGGTGAALPWLQGSWSAPASCNGTLAWAQDPNARIRVGVPRAPYIYLRERY